MLGYRCPRCRRILTRRECVVWDDPQAPFGPELVCPHCESLVLFHAGPFVTAMAVLMAALLGFALGWLLSRYVFPAMAALWLGIPVLLIVIVLLVVVMPLVWHDRRLQRSKRSTKLPADFPETINGLPLPHDLLAMAKSGRWRCPADLSGVDRLFPERGEFTLYSLEYMRTENSFWIHETSPTFLGAADSSNPPGDIDPERSILIGDLGIGYDQPIALDYRLSSTEPRVLTLRWGATGQGNRWVEIAPSIQTFATLLGL